MFCPSELQIFRFLGGFNSPAWGMHLWFNRYSHICTPRTILFWWVIMITGQEVFISSYFIILHRLQGGAVSSAAASAAISTALTLVEQKREQQIDIIEGWNHRCIMWSTRHDLLISNVYNLCHCILEWGLPTSQQDVLAWQKFYDIRRRCPVYKENLKTGRWGGSQLTSPLTMPNAGWTRLSVALKWNQMGIVLQRPTGDHMGIV